MRLGKKPRKAKKSFEPEELANGDNHKSYWPEAAFSCRKTNKNGLKIR